MPSAETPGATHFEEGLTLLADVSHCEAGAGIAHNVGVFRQKAIPEQPPEGRAWLWQGRGGTGPQGRWGHRLTRWWGRSSSWPGPPEAEKQVWLGAEDTPQITPMGGDL